jgi:hypothetical protein
MNRDIYQTITERFIAELKTGTVPWQKPWLSTKLQNDARMIVSAASQAQRSADFIMGIEQKESLLESQLSPEGMPLTWARENGIDTRIPGFAQRDNDEDGISNLMEWKHGTKPNDRLSTPRKQCMSL